MAEVFLAQQRGLEGFDRRVAVKRILPHLVDSPDFVRMFLGEAKLAAQLSHPNIVHIYDFGKVDHDYFIAMEYVDGVHAGEMFKAGEEHEKLSPTLVARIGADAAAALHNAHELKGTNGKPLGLVHRDVSPANIMISYDGVVKLCDFGIAKAAAATDQLTSPGQVKGKYAYMSPEQTVAQPLDGRSDVFSLAIVLWELLTGKLIVPRGDAVTSMRMIRDGKLEPLARAAPNVPPQLAQAITWALETKREKRATATELAQALEAFIKQSPEIATPMQLGGWIRMHFVREHTGQLPSIAQAPIGGTSVVSPGTMAAPPTESSAALGAITPDPENQLIGASRISHPSGEDQAATREIVRKTPNPADAVTRRPFIAPTAPERDDGTGSGSKTIATSPMRDDPTGSGSMTIAKEPIDGNETTVDKPIPGRNTPPARPSEAAADEPTILADGLVHTDPGDDDDGDQQETRLHDRPPSLHPSEPRRIATDFVVPLSGPQNMRISEPLPPSSVHPAQVARRFLTPWRAHPTGDPRREQRIRIAWSIAGLVGLMTISFMVALCATRSHNATVTATNDAAPIVTVAKQIDAGLPDAMVDNSAPPSGSRLVDNSALPSGSAASPGHARLVDNSALPSGSAASPGHARLVVPVDAAVPGDATVAVATGHEAYLEIVTFPDGGKVKVGDQVRVAPAQLVVEAGTFDVVGEMAGYQTETRPVTIETGAHFKVELTFNHHIGVAGHPPPATGKLTIRTTPYSEVFENGKKIGETPFADREMTIGQHTLFFKNPLHPTQSKTITIVAGKPTKLSFSLRD
jgi:serine/threonine protein kinase